jgi:hypothetical protein
MLPTAERVRIKRAKKGEQDIMVQCTACKDMFTISGTVRNDRVISTDYHPHLVRRPSIGTHCHCGGEVRLYLNF